MESLKKPESATKSGSLLLVAAAAALASLSYWSTLRLGLFSEDFIHHYIALESFKHPELIWQSFSQPWTQCSKLGLFWRPLVDLSFMLDCLGGEQVWFYHLVSLLYHIGSAVLVGLIARTIATQATFKHAHLTAILAASLFATSPLAAETLAWLSCRCDGLSCLFSLLSFWLYLQSQTANPASLIAYIAALLCKENAAMLPLVILMHSATFSGKAKTIASAKIFSIVSLLYFCLRLNVLGAIGGYEGAIGEILKGNLLDRLLYPLHWLRIFYPLNESFAYLSYIYSVLYAALFCLILKGTFKQKTTAPQLPAYLLFFLAAAILLMVPASGAFVVNEVLFGGRFLYLPAAFYSLFLAFLLISLGRPGLVFAALYLGLAVLSTNLNLTSWINTDKNLKSLSLQLQKCKAELTLVNVPFNYQSVTSIYDDWQLKLLCKGKNQSLSDFNNLHTTQRLSYIHNLVNYAELKSQCLSGQTPVFFDVRDNRLIDLSALVPIWFEPVDLKIAVEARQPGSSAAQSIDLSKIPKPQRADFIELTVKGPGNTKEEVRIIDTMVPAYEPAQQAVTISWCTNLSSISPGLAKVKAVLPDLSRQTVYRLPLADKVNWKCADKIDSLSISGLPPGCTIGSIRLFDESKLVPRLSAGETILAPGKPITLDFDTSKIEGKTTCLEISKVENAFYIHPMTYRETCRRTGNKLINDLPRTGEIVVNRDMFEKAGHYYLRVQAIDAHGKPSGFCSDPLELTVLDKSFQSEFEHFIFDLRPEKHRPERHK